MEHGATNHGAAVQCMEQSMEHCMEYGATTHGAAVQCMEQSMEHCMEYGATTHGAAVQSMEQSTEHGAAKHDAAVQKPFFEVLTIVA